MSEPIPFAPRQAREADAARSHNGPKHNLPYPISGFVGRRGEVAEVGVLLGESRLVTLTGPGGIGKTRLALEVAARATSRYGDGVWLTELAALAHPGDLPAAVAAVLPWRDPHTDHRSVEELADQVGGRRILLLLDNCEHLVGACAHLVARLLQACPALDVLVGFRSALAAQAA